MVAYSFKPRFVRPILIGLSTEPVPKEHAAELYHPKRQTIRSIGKRRHAKAGDVLQLYTGMRTKHCKLIGIAQCIAIERVQIKVSESSMAIAVSGVLFTGSLDEFAQHDGFTDGADMLAFWKKEHGFGLFEGVLIRWEPISQAQLEAAE